jgi:hypothetical protein
MDLDHTRNVASSSFESISFFTSASVYCAAARSCWIACQGFKTTRRESIQENGKTKRTRKGRKGKEKRREQTESCVCLSILRRRFAARDVPRRDARTCSAQTAPAACRHPRLAANDTCGIHSDARHGVYVPVERGVHPARVLGVGRELRRRLQNDACTHARRAVTARRNPSPRLRGSPGAVYGAGGCMLRDAWSAWHGQRLWRGRRCPRSSGLQPRARATLTTRASRGAAAGARAGVRVCVRARARARARARSRRITEVFVVPARGCGMFCDQRVVPVRACEPVRVRMCARAYAHA